MIKCYLRENIRTHNQLYRKPVEIYNTILTSVKLTYKVHAHKHSQSSKFKFLRL